MKIGNYDVMIDDDDIEKVSGYNWRLFSLRKGDVYFKAYTGYNKGEKDHLFLHRFIMGVTDPKIYIDHKNGDRLDNRKSNLRMCSKAENQRNSIKSSLNKVGVKGVGRDRYRFKARVYVDSKEIYLGSFATLQEAHLAYCRGAIKYYGEFANFDCDCHPDNKLSPEEMGPKKNPDPHTGEPLTINQINDMISTRGKCEEAVLQRSRKTRV